MKVDILNTSPGPAPSKLSWVLIWQPNKSQIVLDKWSIEGNSSLWQGTYLLSNSNLLLGARSKLLQGHWLLKLWLLALLLFKAAEDWAQVVGFCCLFYRWSDDYCCLSSQHKPCPYIPAMNYICNQALPGAAHCKSEPWSDWGLCVCTMPAIQGACKHAKLPHYLLSPSSLVASNQMEG